MNPAPTKFLPARYIDVPALTRLIQDRFPEACDYLRAHSSDVGLSTFLAVKQEGFSPCFRAYLAHLNCTSSQNIGECHGKHGQDAHSFGESLVNAGRELCIILQSA